MNEMESVIVVQATKLVALEAEIKHLRQMIEKLERANEHHLTMRVQQESIIRTLQGDKE